MNELMKTEKKPPSLIAKFAERFGVDPDKMMTTLKATAFKGEKEVNNEQMMALLIVADQYGLNPWTREIYAYPDRSGIVPVVGVDGWSRIINQHPQFDGMSFEQDDASCTCTIFRKDRTHPTKITEYFAECNRPSMGPWKSHPKRMLRHKSMIQCGRIAFGFVGIFDPDEAERIIEAEVEREPSAPIKAPISKSQPTIEPEPITSIPETSWRLLSAKAKAAGVTESEIAEHFCVEHISEIPASEINDVLFFIKQSETIEQHDPTT